MQTATATMIEKNAFMVLNVSLLTARVRVSDCRREMLALKTSKTMQRLTSRCASTARFESRPGSHREIADCGFGIGDCRLCSMSIFACGRSRVAGASSFFTKEILQNGRAFILENTGTDVAVMI